MSYSLLSSLEKNGYNISKGNESQFLICDSLLISYATSFSWLLPIVSTGLIIYCSWSSLFAYTIFSTSFCICLTLKPLYLFCNKFILSSHLLANKFFFAGKSLFSSVLQNSSPPEGVIVFAVKISDKYELQKVPSVSLSTDPNDSCSFPSWLWLLKSSSD